jgi:DNA-binding NarL/FixJ family response regulator
MIILVRHVEKCRSPTVSVRSGPELVFGGRGIDVRGQAGNGREAIVLMGELDPDVVLMEIRMSVMDGVAATRKLTRLGARARVLIFDHI